MAAVGAPLSASNALVSAYSPFSDHFDSLRPMSATGHSNMYAPSSISTANAPLTSVARSPKESSLRAPSNDTAAGSLKSPQTPSVAPSPISSDVGTEFADTEEAVDEAAPDAAPVRVDTKLYDLDRKESDVQESIPSRSAIDRIRSPALKVSLQWWVSKARC
jgi:hypothetical protein